MKLTKEQETKSLHLFGILPLFIEALDEFKEKDICVKKIKHHTNHLINELDKLNNNYASNMDLRNINYIKMQQVYEELSQMRPLEIADMVERYKQEK